MRVFLSAFSGFTLAVPMSAVAAMMLYDKKTETLIQHDQKNQNTYISLPRLFNLNEEEAHHGIILRGENGTANKIVLLTAEIKRDIEIPEKEFHPIPKSLGALRFSKIFSGIKFSDNPVLLLNIEQMTQLIQEEQYVINTKNNSPEPPPSEQPLSEEPLPTVASEPSSPPLPEPESQIEQSTQIIHEDQQARNEIEPLPDQLLLEELPSEPPPSTAASEVEPLTELLVLEELPIEEPPEEISVEETPEELLVEEPLSTAVSEVEPLADLLVLEDLL